MIASLSWGLGLLLIFPRIAYPLRPTMLIVPDLGYLVVTSAAVALTWGILRTVLVYVTLRRPASKAGQTPLPASAASVGR